MQTLVFQSSECAGSLCYADDLGSVTPNILPSETR